ncbi:MAG: AAA family ATPase [Xanthobacteraceae bacterium]
MAQERDLARALIKDALPVEVFVRGNFTFDPISWDDPDAPVAMPAHLTPQEAVNRGLCKPSECDIVVVILWSRMGTPLPAEYTKVNGEPYLSGTEWEYEDAIHAAGRDGKPFVLLYRRTEKPAAELDDPEFDAKRAQYRLVQQFFERFRNPDGSLKGSVHTYARPDEFRDLLRKHLLQIVHQLAQPATALAKLGTTPAFQSRIEAFFDEYLKSETSPVPFGGRDREMAQLDRWLEDARAASRCLLTGPAGRGKSALLIRWAERLQRKGMPAMAGSASSIGWNLVFVPISIRFGTNAQQVFYQALAERLAAVAGQTLETPAINAADFYADKVRDLLGELAASDRRVLVIIDGLDEALRGEFNPTIFPRRLPPTVRVLVSARWQLGDSDSSGWLRRLDWHAEVRCEAIDLDTLDTAAIGHVLIEMGAPMDVVAADRTLVTRLAELTEGEPLLVRFYAMDLWRKGEDVARITRADLDRLKPGFGAYFDRWLENQQKAWREAGEAVNERDIDAILTILAFAHGPLEGADLVRLASGFPGTTQAWHPNQLLHPLRRFVVGDGSRERGYVLSHPKIGQHFQAERFRDARSFVEHAFVEWGQDVLADINRPPERTTRVPVYLLQFYRHHLEDTEAPSPDFLALVEGGWRLAWERYEGSQQGFAGDVQAAWTMIRAKAPLAELAAQFRCVLTLSSIRNLGHNVPQELILAAVEKRVLSVRQALHLAGFMASRSESLTTIGALASRFEPDPARREMLLEGALDAAKAIGNEYSRASALSGLAQYLTGEQIADALHAAKAIGNEDYRASALSGLAQYLTGEQIADALDAAKAIGDEYSRASALSGLAQYLTGEQIADALDAAKAIGNEYYRASALSGLAGHLADEQRRGGLHEVLKIGDRLTRRSFLDAIQAFLSTIIEIGGEETVREIKRAIRDTAAWYP